MGHQCCIPRPRQVIFPSITVHIGSHNGRLATGAVRVGVQLGIFNPFPYLIRSYALHGFLSLTSVIFPTP